jgi:hypothetical protein
MFGLMKARTCSQTDELKFQRRLHYCGTCKTLGSLYGQKTRTLLNHDTVFLAELLSAINDNPESHKSWGQAYQSYNCLALPDAAQPKALQLAATATLVLTEFKIADHIQDSKRRLWKTLQRLFSKSFREANRRLREWQFPVEELRRALLSQSARETQALLSNDPAEAILDKLAEPTAIATALFCGQGARLVEQPAQEHRLYRLGHHFGAIAYLLDAIEDYEKDMRNGDFNALAAAYKISAARLPAEIRRDAVKKLRQLQAQLEALLVDLPMSETLRAMFAQRLQSNLARKLGALPVLNTRTLRQTQAADRTAAQVCQKHLSIAGRWKNAVACSQEIARRYRKTTSTGFVKHWASRITSPMVFASVLPVAFFAPQQTTGAQSYGECMSLGLNLMFIGSVFSFIAMVLAKPFRFSAPQGTGFGSGGQMEPPDITDMVDASRKRRRQQQGNDSSGQDNSSCCDNCDCGLCDCCDGCHCCSECSCCDGCDCCGCDCH